MKQIFSIKDRIFYIQHFIKIRLVMTKLLVLPEYPKVEIEGSAVIIRYENGKSEIWGYEPDVEIAEEVARDIEIGLKAIDYVSFELMKLLSEIGEQLQTLGIPPAYANDYISEGYYKISKWFNELEIKTIQE
jgi:hypothetical protein